MPKRLAFTFIITLALALACSIVFSMVLMLAPGLSLFGFKYITRGTHVVNSSSQISEKVSAFSGSVKIEVEDVDVTVVFSSSRSSYQVDYYDNFVGYTRSNIDDPSIEFSNEADGTAVIKVTSFKKFIYQSNSTTRYIKLFIPSSVVGINHQTNLSIISKTSNVHFCDEKSDNYDPHFKNITIETSGKVTTSTKVYAKNYNLKTSNSINISDDEFASINATNYNLESTGGKIIVSRNVAGDITAKTKNAKIQVLSCNNLTASSGFGDICSAKKDEEIKIAGIANISSTAGSVKIGSILGESGKSVIQTKTGKVDIDKAGDIEITTTRGFVTLNSAKNASITTSSGAITLNETSFSVTAKSKRGKITLGGEDAKLYNPTVESTYGAVYVESASGNVNITTEKSDVTLKNKDASNVKIKCGKKLTATKLIGTVNVEVADDATISFEKFTGASSIIGTNAKSKIIINLLNNYNSTFAYKLEGNDASLYEYNVDSLENHYHIATSTSINSSNDIVGKPLLTAKTTGKLVVYYKRQSA